MEEGVNFSEMVWNPASKQQRQSSNKIWSKACDFFLLLCSFLTASSQQLSFVDGIFPKYLIRVLLIFRISTTLHGKYYYPRVTDKENVPQRVTWKDHTARHINVHLPHTLARVYCTLLPIIWRVKSTGGQHQCCVRKSVWLNASSLCFGKFS